MIFIEYILSRRFECKNSRYNNLYCFPPWKLFYNEKKKKKGVAGRIFYSCERSIAFLNLILMSICFILFVAGVLYKNFNLLSPGLRIQIIWFHKFSDLKKQNLLFNIIDRRNKAFLRVRQMYEKISVELKYPRIKWNPTSMDSTVHIWTIFLMATF